MSDKPSETSAAGKKPAPTAAIQNQSPGKAEPEKGKPMAVLSDEMRILKVLLGFLKYAGAALLIWFFGWFGFGFTWIIIGSLIFTFWMKNQEKKTKKKAIARDVAEHEETAIEARIDELPAWVFFPDVERAEWLNKMIVQLWPYINDMVIKILKEKVEPEIQKNVPGFLSSIYFDELKLGDQPPRIGGIKTYTQNVKRSEIVMDVDLIYAGNSDIRLSVKGMSVGIEDLQLRGTLRVILSPLIPTSPLVGGVSVFFLNRPDIDFDLTNLLNILDIPGLSDIIRGAIDDVVASFVVLPNRITVPLTDIDPYTLKFPLPDGVLRIHVIEAKDLVKKDIGVFKKGSSDPYAVITVGAQTFKTETKEETLNPKWDEVFEVFVDNSQGQKIKIQLFDKDKASDDESLGSVEADISTVVQQGSADLWLPLENVESGQINLRCVWYTFTSSPDDLSPPDKAIQGEEMLGTAALFVKLDSAKNLPVTNPARGTTSAFCKLTVGNRTLQSKTIQDSISPVWEEPFRFSIHDPKYQELDIEVFDSVKEKSIGKLDLPLERLLKDEDMKFEQPFPLKDSGHNSTLSCSLILKALVTREDDTSDEEDGEEEEAGKETSELIPTKEGKDEKGENTAVRRRKPAAPKEKIQRNVTGDLHFRIQYLSQGSKVVVDEMKARDLLPCDSDGLADPYIRAYLLPERAKSSKRRTDVAKNTLTPAFDERFEWMIPQDKLKDHSLQISVKNDVGFFSKSKTNMGEVILNLGTIDLVKPTSQWHILRDPMKED
ncbi:extended synaptotagmin-2-A-like isoform X2 [Actinia tenebrosa]|uniref:Extended synaptotagmin-2-A-like isoform X2 n=1 Tax=Actinia tenebrosa TaxID=6105 RepID=A0A6P8IIY1_ACTTE|nr:extended synaptotagmin-2-A-like isoform X2 [Actinia tenebrosa]